MVNDHQDESANRYLSAVKSPQPLLCLGSTLRPRSQAGSPGQARQIRPTIDLHVYMVWWKKKSLFPCVVLLAKVRKVRRVPKAPPLPPSPLLPPGPATAARPRHCRQGPPPPGPATGVNAFSYQPKEEKLE